MAFDAELADRIRDELAGDLSISEKRMFGGLCLLCNGNMAVGIVGDRLMVRVGPEHWESALSDPDAYEMDFTGRSMKGFVYVDPRGLEGDGLRTWLEKGLSFASSLPPK